MYVICVFIKSQIPDGTKFVVRILHCRLKFTRITNILRKQPQLNTVKVPGINIPEI